MGVDEVDEAKPLLGKRKRAKALSLWHLCGLYAFCFGYGLCLTTYALITFPSEAVRFFPEWHDFGLAGFMLLAGVAQLGGPAIGFFSDRFNHSLGKRRPFLIGGLITIIPCLLIQWHYSNVAGTKVGEELYYPALAYYFASFIGMICLCAMQTVVIGFTTDFVPEHQTGKANGVLVSILGTGSIMGFGLVIFYPTVNIYSIYIIVLCVSAGASLATASLESVNKQLQFMEQENFTCEDEEDVSKESPFGSLSGSLSFEASARAFSTCPQMQRSDWTWKDLLACYWVDKELYPDFYWLFLCRTCYYMGTSTQTFLQYYFRDWVVYNDGEHLGPTNAKAYTALAASCAQIGLALTALPGGHLSDWVGRKRILHCCAAGIATCYVLNVVVHDLWTVLVITFFYGLFNGASLSVSYALAVDCLPTRENGAQWLAMWDVAAFIGTTAGPLICAPVLFFLPPRVQMNGYVANSDSGYIAVMLLGAFFVSFGCYYLEKVREQKVARA